MIESSHLFPLLIQVLSPSQSGRIVALFQFWEEKHGLRWTIKHIKAFGHLLVGGPRDAFKFKGSLVKGPLRPLHWRSRSSRRLLRKILSILRFVGAYKAKITKKDYEHAAKLISQPIPELNPIWIKGSIPQEPVKVPKYPYRIKAVPTRTWVAKHYSFFAKAGVPGLGPRMEYLRCLKKPMADSWGSVYGLNKDGALKMRFVYSPHSTIQAATWPLYYKLKVYTARHCPDMYHTRLEEGKLAVSRLLVKYGQVLSLDFEAATDYFPLEPQLALARDLFPEEALALDFIASRGVFYSPQKVRFQHAVGQPMGLRVSFLLFSLYLYKVLETTVGIGSFCMVGDDVVSRPHRIFHDCGYRISEQKSLLGPYAEFCGTIIDRRSSLDITKKITDPMIFLQSFGKRALYRMFPWWLAQRTMTVSRLPMPWGLQTSAGLLARLTPEQLIDWERKIIPPIPPSADRRELVKKQLTSIGIYYVGTQRGGFHDFDDTLPEDTDLFSRRLAINCVIEHINVLDPGEEVHPILWRIYDLPVLTTVDLESFPRGAEHLRKVKLQSSASYTEGISSVYKKVRRLFASTALAVAAGLAVASTLILPRYDNLSVYRAIRHIDASCSVVQRAAFDNGLAYWKYQCPSTLVFRLFDGADQTRELQEYTRHPTRESVRCSVVEKRLLCRFK